LPKDFFHLTGQARSDFTIRQD